MILSVSFYEPAAVINGLAVHS